MSRVILAQNDDLTPFDLRAQIFRVNVKLSAHYHEQKKFEKMYRNDLSVEIFTVFFFTQFNSKRIKTDK